MEYHHTQIGTLMIVAQALVVAVFIYVVSSEQYELPATAWVVPIIVIGVLGLFMSLTVEIKDEQLRVWFGPGLIRRSIPLTDIAAVRSVRNPWYAGWGIRWMPGRYWLWNVSGLDAVELELKNGKRFRIGTDEPEMLVQAIQNKK